TSWASASATSSYRGACASRWLGTGAVATKGRRASASWSATAARRGGGGGRRRRGGPRRPARPVGAANPPPPKRGAGGSPGVSGAAVRREAERYAEFLGVELELTVG